MENSLKNVTIEDMILSVRDTEESVNAYKLFDAKLRALLPMDTEEKTIEDLIKSMDEYILSRERAVGLQMFVNGLKLVGDLQC